MFTVLLILSFICLTMSAILADIFTYNFSLLTGDIKGYLYVLLMCTLMGLLMFKTWKKHNAKIDGLILLICIIVGGLFPYHGENYSLISSLHVPICYICCFVISIIQLRRLFYYRIYNKQLGNALFNIWIFTLLICLLLWFNYMCINTLIEIIYFSVILITDSLIYYNN